ncbi:hypothetical protein [Neobacillus sp. YIM B06451]|nr:hypothetical protein [Neobacillus sp. YIM B06451]
MNQHTNAPANLNIEDANHYNRAKKFQPVFPGTLIQKNGLFCDKKAAFSV